MKLTRFGFLPAMLLPFAALAQPAPVTPNVNWTLFTDPVENAFALDVPRGWSVKGGTARLSPIVALAWVSATSADHSIRIFVGDPEIPGFRMPLRNQGEGIPVRAPNPQLPPAVVLNYRPGAALAALYGPQSLAMASCTDAKPTGTQPLPDLERAELARSTDELRGVEANAAIALSPRDAGLATFTCQRSRRPVAAGVIAATVRPTASGSWRVTLVAGYQAPPGQEASALAILNHMLLSRQWNPQWDEAMREAIEQAFDGRDADGAQIGSMLLKQSQDFKNLLSPASGEYEIELAVRHQRYLAEQTAQSKLNTASFLDKEKQRNLFAWKAEAVAPNAEMIGAPGTRQIDAAHSDTGETIPVNH